MTDVLQLLAGIGTLVVTLFVLATMLGTVDLISKRSFGSMGGGDLAAIPPTDDSIALRSHELHHIEVELSQLPAVLATRINWIEQSLGVPASDDPVVDVDGTFAPLDQRLDAIEAALGLPPIASTPPAAPPRRTP